MTSIPDPHFAPYLTKRQLIRLIDAGHTIIVMAMSEPHKQAAVWYGAWSIWVPAQRGVPERRLAASGRGDAPHLRVCKTANGLISLMCELGFRDICLPMEKGGSVSHRIGREPVAATHNTISSSEAAPQTLDTLRTSLLQLAHCGFVSADHAGALIEAGYARPVALHVRRDGAWPCKLEAIHLTPSGETTAQMIGQLVMADDAEPETVPDYARVITEDYIRQQADAGVHVADIICARSWYSGPDEPERRAIMQPPVLVRVSARRRRSAARAAG